jgi:hypothetical protein
MSTPSVGINCGIKLITSSKLISLLFRTIFKELKQTRDLFTDGSLEVFPSSTFMRTKSGATRCHKSPPYLPWRPWPSPRICINKIQGHNFSIYSDSRSMTTAISSSTNFIKGSPIISPIKETKAARKQIKIQWIPAHRGITRNEKADELAKHSIRHRRGNQIHSPAKYMKTLRRKKSKEES